MSDQELYEHFWAVTGQVVEPLIELGKKNTTPSVERAVLMRMGISSQKTQAIVEGCMDKGLMGKGAGHCVYKLSKAKNISLSEAGDILAEGKGWDEVAALFKGGK